MKMKRLPFFLFLVIVLSCAMASPTYRDGDMVAMVNSETWALLHADGTWESATFEQAIDLLGQVPGGIVASNASSQTQSKNWDYKTGVDPITDVRWHLFLTEAVSGGNRYGEKPCLRIYITEAGAVWVSIWWGEYLGSRKDPRVTWRMDRDAPCFNDIWQNSSDEKTTFVANGYDENMVKRFVNAETFIAQTTPYSSNTMTATFDVTGVRQFIKDTPSIEKVLYKPSPFEENQEDVSEGAPVTETGE
jgi:hypothetical protein